MNSTDKASQAYASIESQLQHWGDDDNMDDAYAMNYVSKRQSGAFSPMASSAGSPKPMTPATNSTASKFRFATSPVATPLDARAPIHHGSNNEEYDQSDNDAFNANDDDDSSMIQGVSIPSFVNQAALDGDYRPYHDALLSLRSKSKAMSQQSALQYIQRVTASAYSRSSQLKEHDDSNNEQVESARQQLEQEGHFWSLIGNLASSSSNHDASRSMLLYQPPSALAIQREIDSFIASIVAEFHYLDPAAMATLVQQAMEQAMEQDGGDEDEDEDGGANSGKHNIPMVVRRRQVILDWIQSCHGRSVSNKDLPVENKENSVMWKDTIDKFNRDQHSFMGAKTVANHKIHEFHPDAPLLIAGENGKNGNALHGKDNDREIVLLQKCLLLIKAGRMTEMFELCHAAGQPWRAAAWDGDMPHGYSNAGTDGQEREEEEVGVDNYTARVGNPQRALWKRNMWEVSKSFHEMIQQDGQDGVSQSSTLSSGCLVHEAAISAILADDYKTASKNPLLNQNWMDSMWIFYRGLYSRFNELVYNTHNNARRNVESGAQSQGFGFSTVNSVIVAKYPVEGAEFRREEEEQLKCTSEMSHIEEGAFIARLRTHNGAQMYNDWERGISAFLTSEECIESYLENTINTLIQVASQSEQTKMSREAYEPLLRFMVHVILFFDFFCDEKDSSTAKFYSTSIAPNRNNLILAYLQMMMEQKPLWGFTGLYASLLPDDSLIESCTDFWSTNVFDEKDRRIMIKNACTNFEEGMDLIILRNVVRSSLQSVDGFHDPLNVAFWLGRETSNERFNEDLEVMITHDDVRKMHSIRWLTFDYEHYADALVCANMLMRSLLLELRPSIGEATNDQFDDWTANPKLYTAKVLQARFLPADITKIAMEAFSNDQNQLDRGDLSLYTDEYEALRQFLDAHNAYERWKDFIVKAPANVPFILGDRYIENSTESDVAIKMETMKYVKKKKEMGLGLIKSAQIARESLMHVLEFDGGWLYAEETDSMNDGGNEFSDRKREMISVRSKCLPITISLVFRICHSTALWMDEFMRDVEDAFPDQAPEIMARITSKEIFQAEGLPNPFEATTWHREALLLANTVASRGCKISECLSNEDLNGFMNYMAETNICLLIAQENM